jgi:hypothetical protein
MANQSMRTAANPSDSGVKTQAVLLDIGRCVPGTECKAESNRKES